MLIGMLHTHKTLAYAIFLVALVNLVLATSKGRTDPTMAKVLHWTHTAGLLMAGRLNIVVGFVLWFLMGMSTTGTIYLWISLILWGPIEVASKRMVKPEVALVQDGGQGSSRLVMGTAIELVCIVVIFGLMSARPF